MTGSRRPDTPWLGKVGLTGSAILFLLGGAVPIALASPAAIYPLSAAQITWTLITAAALIIAAFLSVRFRRPLRSAMPTSPWTVFAITVAAGPAFWIPSLLAMVGIKLESIVPAWITVGFYLALYATMTLLILRWSRCTGWGPWHRFALGAAGLVTYAWHGFPQPPSFPAPANVDLMGNAVFALAALGLLAFVGVRLRRTAPTPSQPGGGKTTGAAPSRDRIHRPGRSRPRVVLRPGRARPIRPPYERARRRGTAAGP
ncbi:hypothetical protein [Microtetraspora malaysiensis]|uniref:hypothetical protein n=1 Tax=Microtetraspora malaysiensis TaxID=161358 RepID=UPI003D937AB8